jgi:hypothetical protein
MSSIRITFDEYNFATSFECLNVTEATTPVTLNFLYDMAYNKTVGVDLSRANVEAGLLEQVASYYGVWDGTACNKALADRIWYVSMSSLDMDIPNPKLGTFGGASHLV